MEDLFVKKEQTLFEILKNEKRPIVVYGMGNGADKIFDICESRGIKISDIFASDEFVRGHSFRNIRVKTYSEVCELYDDFVILLAFAVFKDDLMEKIVRISKEHTLFVPDVPLFGSGLFDYDFLTANIEKITEAYECFADEISKQTFVDVINFRLTGIPELLFRCEASREEVFSSIIRLSENEDYVDLGAYDGDTIREFLENTNGGYSSITAFEPDKKNMKKLARAFGELDNCRLLPYASWEDDREMRFSGSGGRMSCFDDSGEAVKAKAVDSVCEKASYIKMDVEGAEYETINGCRRIIGKYKPALAVSAYHRAGDIFTLPLLIRRLSPDYKIYLRHHKYLPSWETNVYAVKA